MYERHRDENLHDTARKASRELVLTHLGWPAEMLERDPAGAVLAALRKLPQAGPISDATEQLLVRAIAWLVNDIPFGVAGKAEVERALADAMHRVLGPDGDSW